DLATGEVTVVAGVAQIPGYANGTGLEARFHTPRGVWGDGRTLYVADRDNFSIRKVDEATGAVVKFAGSPDRHALEDGIGTNASFAGPTGLWSDGVTLYVTDSHSIRSIALATGQVSTIAGSDIPGAQDGIGTQAQFTSPVGLWAKDGMLYIADTGNAVI